LSIPTFLLLCRLHIFPVLLVAIQELCLEPVLAHGFGLRFKRTRPAMRGDFSDKKQRTPRLTPRDSLPCLNILLRPF